MTKKTVFVVHYNTVFDGRFSCSGVAGVFSSKTAAEALAVAKTNKCTEAVVTEWEVDGEEVA